MLADRIRKITQQWFLTEPLLFGAWSSHQVAFNESIQTVRTGRGRIELSPVFCSQIDDSTLREVMKFETLRIILKHPYQRRKPHLEYSLSASNISINECIQSTLDMPTAKSTFGSKDHDRKHFEYYYDLLAGIKPCGQCNGKGCSKCSGAGDCNDVGDAGQNSSKEGAEGSCKSCGGSGCKGCSKSDGGSGASDGEEAGDGTEQGSDVSTALIDPIGTYCDASKVAIQNTQGWDYDQFMIESLNDLITEIQAGNNWGTLPGSAREQILASRIPKLDYRKVLKSFRASILATKRRLTRMKPSRRYGFQYMGSRRDFTTKLLFAVDVSGSVSSADVQNAFSIVNRLFKYGIESVDVVWFDTQIRNPEKPLSLKKAQRNFQIDGRGGTNFQPIMDYLDKHRDYDGVVVFTDGIACIPNRPKRNRKTRMVWLFNNESNWRDLHEELSKQAGMSSAFVKSG